MSGSSQHRPSGKTSALNNQSSDDIEAALAKAEANLRTKLGESRWSSLHSWTRSSLVTSELFYSTLERIDATREAAREAKGSAGEAPEIDFSPVVLGLYKAIEIEFERTVLRPFKEQMLKDSSLRVKSAASAKPSEAVLRGFIQNERPAPALGELATVLMDLRHVRAENSGLLESLKLWMRQHLVKPHQWWTRAGLAKRLDEAVRDHRNAAAHTKRFSPNEAKKVKEHLWGLGKRDGVLVSGLRGLVRIPVRGEPFCGYLVESVKILTGNHWYLLVVDPTGDRYWLSIVAGAFQAIESLSAEMRKRREIRHENLINLKSWFPAEPSWGHRVVIASDHHGSWAARNFRRHALSESDCVTLARALSAGVMNLHSAGFLHGFICPHVIFGEPSSGWKVGGQSLILLANQKLPVFLYPRVVPSEVDLKNSTTFTPASDVYSIAATVCCLRQGAVKRNFGAPHRDDVITLFSDPKIQTAVRRALSVKPSERQADAAELFAELGGSPVEKDASKESWPVVVSYSRQDEKSIEELVRDLQARGVRAWRDQDMIPGGIEWRQAIVTAIERCRIVLFLVSSASLASEQVVKEIQIAADAKKTIIPILLEDVPIRGTLQYILTGVQNQSFFRGAREKNMTDLMRTLGQHGVIPD